jgi:hypothetical protein
MSTGEHSGYGTVYHPGPDAEPNGAPRPLGPAQLRSLPRRRRPAMIALAVALIGAGILGSAALYQRENHQVAVLVVTATVPAGATITAADVGATSVAAGPGVQVIPAAQLHQVIGLVAATALRPGSLLAPAEVTSSRPPGSGQALVPIAIRPSGLPASGLAPGDHITVVPTSSAPGGSGSGAGASALSNPVPGVVEAVTGAPDQDGFDVVDLLVSTGSAASLAQQAATGDIAVYVTSRSPQ